MFDIGFQELTLLGVIALIVVGPERLPKMARTLGLWMGKIRYYVNQVKRDIDQEVRAQELKEMLNKPARELEDVYTVAKETKDTLDEAKGALGEAKAALEDAPASVSTPNEPAAGSIFPTELPAAGTEPARNEAASTNDSAAAASAETDPDPARANEVGSGPPESGEPDSEPQAASDRDTSVVAATAGENDEKASEKT